MARRLFLTPPVSTFRPKHSVTDTRDGQQEIIIVTSKQYLAVADDFLRKLFPEITEDRLASPGPFTVFIADDVIH